MPSSLSLPCPDDLDLHLPEPDAPLLSHADANVSWHQCMAETAERTRLYLLQHDDPLERLQSKVAEFFVLD